MANRCECCGYSMVGLPDQRLCPKCGFDYDRSAEVITQSRRGPVVSIVFGLLVLVLCIATWRIRHRNDWYVALFVANVFIALTCCGYGWLCLRQRNVAILTEKELCVIGRLNSNWPWTQRKSWRAEWRSLKAIAWSSYFEPVVLRSPNGAVLLKLEREFFGSFKRTEAFVERANALIAKASSGDFVAPA